MALNITIIGAGISGLTAATALRLAGHKVTIHERSTETREIGQGIAIASNATRILSHIGFNFERANLTPNAGMKFLDSETLQDNMPDMASSWHKGQSGVAPMTSYRPDLHRELVRIATTAEGPGIPVEIVLDSPVTNFEFAETGKIVLANGVEKQADMVIAADGVHSKAATALLHPEKPPEIKTGEWYVYRFTLPHAAMLADPELEALKPREDFRGRIVATKDGAKWLIWYFCRNQEMCSFGLYTKHPVVDDQQFDQRLQFKVDRAILRKEMQDFHPTLHKLVDLSTDVLPLWRCTSRQPLKTHTRGQLVVIGDAAHPLLPLQGWGAVTGIEDGGFLGALFEDVPGDCDPAEVVRQRLRLYSEARVPRLAVCQCYSNSTMFGDAVVEQKESVEKWISASDLPESKRYLSQWFYGYDAVEMARGQLRAVRG